VYVFSILVLFYTFDSSVVTKVYKLRREYKVSIKRESKEQQTVERICHCFIQSGIHDFLISLYTVCLIHKGNKYSIFIIIILIYNLCTFRFPGVFMR